METQEINAPEGRPRMLRMLCTASFINQGVAFFLYGSMILISAWAATLPLDEFRNLLLAQRPQMLSSEQLEHMEEHLGLVHASGVLIFGIGAARTAVRAFGTWQMWKLKKIGLHIYVSAQLLGILVPMLVIGQQVFDLLGFLMALSWCYYYWSVRRFLA